MLSFTRSSILKRFDSNLETSVWSIRSSNVFITSDRKVTKNVFPISAVRKWIEHNCQISFRALSIWNTSVFAADNFPPLNPNNAFMIVNTSKSVSVSLDSNMMPPKKNIYCANPLRLPLFKNSNINERLRENFNQVTALMTGVPKHNQTLPFGVLFVFILHVWFLV